MADVRLIDANALKEKLQADHDFYVHAWGGVKNLPANDKARVDELTASIAAVVNSPTIDAVEVVRCRECKHRGYDACPMCHDEYYYDEDDGGDWVTHDKTEDDGFCHMGAKMDAKEG